MAMNRVQFQPGLSMAQFMERYGSEDKCEAALMAARWPGGFELRALGVGGSTSSTFVREGRRYWQCSACRHQCTLISSTIFASSKLPLMRWFLAMHLLTQAKNNVSALELKRHLGVSYKSALAGQAQSHGSHAPARGRARARRAGGDRRCLPWGASAAGARAGAARRTRCPSWWRCKPPRRGSRCSLACANSPPPSRGGGDLCRAAHDRHIGHEWSPTGCGAFAPPTQIVGADHERVVTGGGRASVELAQLKAVNTVLSNLKTAASGHLSCVQLRQVCASLPCRTSVPVQSSL